MKDNGRFPSFAAFHNRLKGARPDPSHFFIIVTGALANVTFVTLGLHGAFGVHPTIALAIAAWLILMQGVLFESCRRNGLLLNTAGSGFYGLFVAFNVLLAAGGLTAYFGADTLGRSQFRQSVAAPRAAIHAVTKSTSDFAAAMSSVASHSGERHQVEVARGGTCSESRSGSGPISRLREDDAAMFASARQTMDLLASQGREITTTIDTQIANYSVARHQQTVAAIGEALRRAQQLASDPRISEVRRTLQVRGEQIGSGRPDRLDPSVRVLCPRDRTLGEVVGRALNIPAPRIADDFELPAVPSEATSVRGLFEGILLLLLGREVDLGPWLASLGLAPIPDALFIYGLTLHRRQRKARQTLEEEVAEGLGLAASDLSAEMDRALGDVHVQELYASHIVQHGWVFRTDWLAIPEEASTRRTLTLRLVAAKKAFDAGLCKGSELPAGAAGFERNARYHLFALKPRIWARLEAETIRAALTRRNDFDPPPTAGGYGPGVHQDQAA